MSRRAVPRRNASDLDWSDPTLDRVARFGRMLARLIDIRTDTVLVAVSGGADSVALLLLARAVLKERCVAATVDHGMRAASADEAAFVAALCAERGIRHETLMGELPRRVGRTANLSTRARALRYRLLEEKRSRDGLDWIATAHHADDQLETFVMRANRGAGVAGLAGIRRKGGRIIRPLMALRRSELAALVANEGVVPVDDPSNVDERFDRARLRKLLAEVDWLDAPRIVEATAALAAADDALKWSADQTYDRSVQVMDGVRRFQPHGIPGEIVRRIIVRCLTEIDGDCEADGPGVARLLLALGEGRASMLGNVLVSVTRARDGTPSWHFRPAPPRRSH